MASPDVGIWNDNDEYDYYALANPTQFVSLQKELNSCIFSLLNRLIRQPNSGDPSGSYSTIDYPQLYESCPAKELLDHLDPIIEFNDVQMEEIDALSDRLHGLSDRTTAESAIASAVGVSRLSTSARIGVNDDNEDDGVNRPSSSNTAVGSVGRPQLLFEDVIDNSDAPFVPKILEKPNALVPLDPVWHERSRIRALAKANTLLSNNQLPEVMPSSSSNASALTGVMRDHLKDLGATSSNFSFEESAPHPYQHEIDAFEYTDHQLSYEPEIPPRALEETPLHMINSQEDLDMLLAKLSAEPFFAIDLENHNYRSYQGFVCLMQLSTTTEDFIVDTLLLRSKLSQLNVVFTNPRIVKILHGCDSDVVWLQRDFGLYLVNVFDTGQASRVLELAHFSLAYLTEHYCGVKLDKRYQLADWRLRPLPPAMVQYARMDTHYLMYLYLKLKNELIVRGNDTLNLLRSVLLRSRELCKLRYEKELLTPTSHEEIYNKSNFMFTQAQLAIFAALFRWRDVLSRQEDESARYILPNHILLHIAHVSPKTTDELFRCCQVIPPYIRIHALEIVDLIATTLPQQAAQATAAPSNELISNFAAQFQDYVNMYVHGDDSVSHQQESSSSMLADPVPLKEVSPLWIDSANHQTKHASADRLRSIYDSFDLSATVVSFVHQPAAPPPKALLPPASPEKSSDDEVYAMKGPLAAPSRKVVTKKQQRPTSSSQSATPTKSPTKKTAKATASPSPAPPPSSSSSSEWKAFDYSKVVQAQPKNEKSNAYDPLQSMKSSLIQSRNKKFNK